MRNILFAAFLTLLSACSQQYSPKQAAERLSFDLEYPYHFSLPNNLPVIHGYSFGGRHRGHVFLLQTTPQKAAQVITSIRFAFATSAEYSLTIGTEVTTAPFGFGYPQGAKILTSNWWQPWNLHEPKTFDIKRTQGNKYNVDCLWFAVSEPDGLIYVVVAG